MRPYHQEMPFVRSSATNAKRHVSHKIFAQAFFALLLLLGGAWSPKALAYYGTCDLSAATTTQVGTPGQTLNFSYNIADNNCDLSGGTVVNVTITSDSTGEATLVPSASYTGNSGTAGFSINLGATAGEIVTITAQCQLNCASAPNDQIIFTASSPATPVLSYAKVLTSNADEDGTGTVTVGDTLTYTSTATNTSSAPLTLVQVGDPLTSPNTISCASLAVGASCVLTGTYVVTAADLANGYISNTATFAYAFLCTARCPPPYTATLRTRVYPAPSMTVSKVLTRNTDGDRSRDVSLGDALLYTVTATNTGQIALTNVHVNDPLMSPNTTTCSTVPIGGSCKLVGSYTVTAADVQNGSISNTGTATANGVPGTPSSNTVTTDVYGKKALSITKVLSGNADGDGSGTVTLGDVLTYTITGTNTGGVPLSYVFVYDSMIYPDSTECQNLAVGATCVLTGTYTVTSTDVANGYISNTATADNGEGATVIVKTTLRTPVVTNPAMAITKAITNNADGDDSGTVTLGDVLTYTVTATNTGNVALTNVTVSDPLTTPNSTTCANVAVGSTCVLAGTYTVTSGDAKRAVIDNTGSATSIQTSKPTSITIHTPVVSSPQISVVKALTGNADGDRSGTVTKGDVLTYKITVTNTGDVTLNNVQVSDPLTTPNATTCSNLAVGGTCVLSGTYTVTATDASNGTISNTGSASTNQISTTQSNTVNTQVFALNPAMTVYKHLDDVNGENEWASIHVGDVLTYRVTMTNTGNIPLTNVHVSDPLTSPNSKTCATVAVSGTCVLTGNYTVTATDATNGTISNTGSAATDQVSPTQSNTVNTTVMAQTSSMTVVKALTHNADGDASDTVTVGDVLTYTVTVTNTGDIALTNVHVNDPLTTPNATTCATVAVSGTCVLTGNYTVTATDATNGTISNTGSAATDQISSTQSNTVNTAVVATVNHPAMTLVKALTHNADGDASGTVTVGDVLTYTVTLTNTGDITLTNVVVNDPLTTPNSTSCGDVLPAGTCVMTGTYTVTPTDATTGTITNRAEALTGQLDPWNSNTVITPVVTATTNRTITIEDGDNQSGPPNTAINPLAVTVYNDSTQANGVTINWAVTSGTATLSNPTSIVYGGGATIGVTLGATAGPVTITATRADDTTKFVTFHETITGTGTPALTKVSGDSQKGMVGTSAPYPLVVNLLDGSDQPMLDATVTWQVISGPAVLSAASSSTGSGGNAQINFDFGTSTGDSVIRATYGTATVDFHATTLAYQITILGGNGQTAAPGQSLPQDFSVAVSLPSGVTILSTHGPSTQSVTLPGGVSGVPVQWQILGGGGSLSQGGNTTTDSSGHSSNHYTLGNSPGSNQVQVSVPGGTSVTFSATSVAPTAAILKIVSGDAQSLTTNTTSAPLVVELTSGGVPVPNATISWTAHNATLGVTTSVTDSNGRASNTAAVKDPGAASVTAASTSPSASPVSFGLTGGIAHLSGLSPQQTQVANAFDHACPALAALNSPTPAQQDLLAQCDALAYAAGHDPDEARNALNQMFFDVSFLETSAAMLISTEQFDNIKARIAALRSGTGGSHFGGLAFASPNGTLPIGSLGESMLGIAADKKDDQKQEVGSGFDRWGFFASGTFGNGSADPRQVTPGYGFHTSGLTAGVDYRFSDKLIFGVSAGYAKYSSNVNAGRGGMDTSGWSLSAYSTFFHQDSWYLDGVLTYGSNTYDITRDIIYTLTTNTGTTSVHQVAASNSNGSTLAGALTFGRDFVKGPWSFGPYFRGTYTRVSFDGSHEVLISGLPGNGLGFAIQSRDLTSVASVLGAKLNYVSSQSWGVMMPHAEVEWQHEFSDSPDSLTARFLQDPTATPITVKGDSIDTDFFRLGLGMSFVFTHGRSGFIYYEKTLGRTGITQDNIALGMRLEF